MAEEPTPDALLGRLRAELARYDAVTVAFSGGADSAFLAYVAHTTLGAARTRCITAVSPSLAGIDLDHCRRLAADWGLRWEAVETTEHENPAYLRNDLDRCYHCKTALMDALDVVATATADGISTVVLGVNLDDLDDHRPGQQAAAERGARFPLVDAGLTKADIRTCSRLLGLSTWDRPAAPCLASRVPYGTPVTIGVLGQVERAEAGLRALGWRDLRVRHHGELARVEVPVDELGRALAAREEVVAVVRQAGYRWVTLDLDGLRSGNLNPGPAARTAPDAAS